MDEPPSCPNCGQQMRLVAGLPAQDGLPGVEGFRCERCGEELVREVE